MEVIYKIEALKDIEYWEKTNDRRIQKKISELIERYMRTSFYGKRKA